MEIMCFAINMNVNTLPDVSQRLSQYTFMYRKVSNIRRTKSQNLNAFRLIL